MKTDVAWASLIEACYQECPDLTVEAVFQQGLSERRFFENLGHHLEDGRSAINVLRVNTLEDL